MPLQNSIHLDPVKLNEPLRTLVNPHIGATWLLEAQLGIIMTYRAFLLYNVYNIIQLLLLS